MTFGHERFEAYQIAIRFFSLSVALVEDMPQGHSVVKDQLRRAALSILLNIAEGSGKFHEADKKRFYGIARGSAMECASLCDVMELIGHPKSSTLSLAKDLLLSIVSILSSVNSKKSSSGG